MPVVRDLLVGAVTAGVVICSVESGAAQSREERVQSLAEEVIPVRTIEPADPDLSDLEPLRQAFANARLVLLGEQTHGDGAALLAKARMIRFLHQEMGFDVLAFESGFYDCAQAQADMDAGDSAHAAIPRCVYGVWSASAEFRPTVDYLEETRSGPRPLRLAGFDSQPNGAASSDQLVDDLRSLAAEADYEFDWSEFDAILRDLADLSYQYPETSPPTEQVRVALEEDLYDFAAAVAESSVDDRDFWAQVIRSVAADARMVWMQEEGARIDAAQVRAQQMAENLLWLLDHAYQGRKVIVWAHTFHASRNLSAIEVESDDPATLELYRRGREIGDYLEERLELEMYSVAFIAQGGEWGFPMLSPSTIPEGEPESLEAMLSDAGFEFAFLDLRHLEPSAGWLDRPIPSRLYDYIPMTARWGDVVDGLFFINRMTPSTAGIP